MTHATSAAPHSGRRRRLVVGAVLVLAVSAAVIGTLFSRVGSVDERPGVVAALRRDPMGSFRPPAAIGAERTTQHEADMNMGGRTVGEFVRTFAVPAESAKAAFAATVTAARHRGWRAINTGIENDATRGVVLAFTATRERHLQGEDRMGNFTLTVSLGGRPGGPTKDLAIGLTASPSN